MKTRALVIGIYVLFSGFVFAYSVASPIFHWDLLAYVACASMPHIGDPDILHDYAYGEVRKAVAAPTYAVLGPESETPYNATLAREPGAFLEALPFYRTRVLYILLLSILTGLGLNVVFASHLISAASVLLAAWVLLLMVWDRVEVAFVVALPLVCLSFGWLEVSRLATPDGLALLGVLATALLFLRSSRLVLIMLPLLVMIRTDLLLFAVPVGLVLALAQDHPRALVVISVAATIGAYLLIDHWSGHPGWQTVFYHTLVGNLTHPISTPVQLTMHDYLATVWAGFKQVLRSSSMLMFAAMVAASAAIVGSRGQGGGEPGRWRGETVLLVCVVCFVVLHFVLFPVTWERFFVGPYLLGAVALASLVSRGTRRLASAPRSRSE